MIYLSDGKRTANPALRGVELHFPHKHGCESCGERWECLKAPLDCTADGTSKLCGDCWLDAMGGDY